jgi:hypothetical protein
LSPPRDRRQVEQDVGAGVGSEKSDYEVKKIRLSDLSELRSKLNCFRRGLWAIFGGGGRAYRRSDDVPRGASLPPP